MGLKSCHSLTSPPHPTEDEQVRGADRPLGPGGVPRPAGRGRVGPGGDL